MRYNCLLPALLAVTLIFSCSRDPEVANNDPDTPQVELEILSRISAEISIVSTVESSDITYGGEIIQIIDGEERGVKYSFTTESLDENHRYTWLTENLQPNSTYVTRAFITNGRNKKYSASKTYSTPSTSKPTLSSVMQDGESLIASIVDNGGRTIDDVGFVIGDTPDRKELMRKEKIPAAAQTKERFSLPLNSLPSGKTLYVIAYAIDSQEDTGYSSTPIEVFVPQPVTSITLSHEELVLVEGTTAQLEADVQPENASDKSITWESSDNEVATVEEGNVTAIKEGTAIITASAGEKSASCTVTVVKDKISFSLSFTESEGEVYIGEDFIIQAIVTQESATDITLTWESSDPNVALVSQEGYVSPIGVGVCTITASAYDQSASFQCNVVSEAPVFPDEAFRNYIYSNFDSDLDGILSRKEVMAISDIDISERKDIYSLSGIEYLDHLVSLYCYFTPITSLDVSNCTQLKWLWCQFTQISFLDVSNCTLLESIDCGGTDVSSLDVSNCTLLRSLGCGSTQISSLDVSNCTMLGSLECSFTQISSLDVSNCTQLQALYCDHTQISSLDVSNCIMLGSLDCSANQISSLDVSNCTQLQVLNCVSTQISSLNVSNCKLLKELRCGYTQISSLNLSNCTQLGWLICQFSQVSSLDISKCTQLQVLDCNHTQISSLDVSNCTMLGSLDCSANQLSSLDVSKCTLLGALDFDHTQISTMDVSNCTQLELIDCGSTEVSSLDVSNCTLLRLLDCHANQISSLDLRNNENLQTLSCHSCPNLTDIWLIAGHEYETLSYDSDVATLHYE